MKRAALLVLLACGCHARQPPQRIDLLCECFSQAAYEVIAAERAAGVTPGSECCRGCGKNGLPKGKVMSGDGITVVPCPCPDSCECKRK